MKLRPFQVPKRVEARARALSFANRQTRRTVSAGSRDYWNRCLALVQPLRWPVFKPGPQCQAARSQHFLDFVERLAAQVRGLQQLSLGALDQVTDVVDVLGLQAVG